MAPLQERALKLRKWVNKMQLYLPEIALLESVVSSSTEYYVCSPALPRSVLHTTHWTIKIASLLTLDCSGQDVGKPLSIAKHVDVPFAIEMLEYCAGFADGKICGETVWLAYPLVASKKAYRMWDTQAFANVAEHAALYSVT